MRSPTSPGLFVGSLVPEYDRYTFVAGNDRKARAMRIRTVQSEFDVKDLKYGPC